MSYPVTSRHGLGAQRAQRAQRWKLKVRRKKDSEEQGWRPGVVWGGSPKCWNLISCSALSRQEKPWFTAGVFFCDTYLARLPWLPYVCEHHFLARPTFICPFMHFQPILELVRALLRSLVVILCVLLAFCFTLCERGQVERRPRRTN